MAIHGHGMQKRPTRQEPTRNAAAQRLVYYCSPPLGTPSVYDSLRCVFLKSGEQRGVEAAQRTTVITTSPVMGRSTHSVRTRT